MFKRKITSILKDWKSDPDRNPIIVKGCRQCGKTFSVKDFAYKNYKNVIYMDFHEQQGLRELFADSLTVDYLTMAISAAMPDAVFAPHETCIIFDEIQECPRARTSLKYFKLDGRYDVICTGSLLGVNGYNSSMESIPVGYETVIDMYPMDFEEWLWANGIKQSVFDFLKKSLVDETPVATAIHNRMRQLLLEYVIVGGMPRAVSTFLDTHDVNRMIVVQRGIVDDYKSDMVKYARSEDRSRIRECFDSIPRQLARDNKKFTYSVVRKGGRSKEYTGCLQWIEDAGIVRRCHNLMITELPLGGNALQDCFKIYMADTGLFVSMLDDGTQLDILQGRLNGYKGAIYENLLADILGKMGRKLYYFQKTDSLEIDFVMRYKGECTPVECKARTGNAKSMRTLLNHPEKYHVYNAIKLGDYNVGRDGALLTLPIYMAFLLTEV
ncbi:MAG: ATP-binding protein [Bacteroidales bacterium]|nr:ATP-binding protein [Candidatus Sodaliphilus limicaballi]